MAIAGSRVLRIVGQAWQKGRARILATTAKGNERGRASAPQGTLHERLLREFHGKIVSRAWPPGFQLPFETDLALAYGVSRMTMNKVLGQLTRDGYLVRRRRLGTFVAAPRAQSAALAINDIEADVRALGLEYRFALVGRDLRAPTPGECDELDRPGGAVERPGLVLALDGVHFAGPDPFCHEARIINPAAAPRAPDQDFRAIAPGAWLRAEVPWTSADHIIRAVGAEPRLARHLGVAPGAPCLEITRRTELAGVWVTLVRQTYPGALHQLQAQFAPRPGEAGRDPQG